MKTYSKITFAVVVAALFLSISANSQTHGDTVNTGKTSDRMVINPGISGNAIKQRDGMSVMTDTGFIMQSIEDNKIEIAIAKMGVAKGNTAVKNIGRQIMAAHIAMLADLQKLAANSGIKSPANPEAVVPPSMQVDAGRDFNTTWASVMLTMHDDQIADMEKFMPATSNKSLKNFIGTCLPKLNKDRQILSNLPGAKSESHKMVM